MTGIGTLSELVGCTLNVYDWYCMQVLWHRRWDMVDLNEAHHLMLTLAASMNGSSLK